MNKCDKCLNARSIISENGLHRVCALRNEKAAMDCLMGIKSERVVIYPDEYENIADGGKS